MRIGKYELLSELASGGMGTVHVSRQTGDGGFSRLVVVKRLHAHLANESEFRNMVRDEAMVASQIRHPNVVPVLDVVEHENEICLVMEYVPSVPLSVLIRAAKANGELLPAPVVSRIIGDVLGGLHAAHEVRDLSGNLLEVVHRDVSPQNVLVGVDGCARLIDFGIAKAAVRYARTKSGDLKGKISFMSPEQLQRKEVDRRADIFAAGALLFETLSGTPLFDGMDEGAILLGILMGKSRSLSAYGLPPEVDELVTKATEKDREERFATARLFEEALEATIPPASSHEVAAIVQRLCGTTIDERRELIRARVEESERRAFETVEATSYPSSATNPSTTTATKSSRRWPFLIAGSVATIAAFAFLSRATWGPRDIKASPNPSSESSSAAIEATRDASMNPPPTLSGSAPSATLPAPSASSEASAKISGVLRAPLPAQKGLKNGRRSGRTGSSSSSDLKTFPYAK